MRSDYRIKISEQGRRKLFSIVIVAMMSIAGFVGVSLQTGNVSTTDVSGSALIAFDVGEGVENSGDSENLSDEDWDAIQGLIQEAQYYFTRHDPSEGFAGYNSKSGFGMIFNENGASVSPNAEKGWSWDIVLSGFGYSGQVSPITVKPQLSVDKNRVEYEYSPQLTEWYISDEKGLEQGFTIETPPQPRINAPLVIEMALDTTLTPRAINNGEAIAFFDNSGEHILTYRDLIVVDALGQDVSAWLSLSDTSSISIYIDDTSSVYPLTIDPLIVTEVKKLVASDGAAWDMFGVSVSISGDTIVIGAYMDNIWQGSAYVFERNQGGADNWGEVKKLTALDGAMDDMFGVSVSISGDTIVIGAHFDDVGAGWGQGSGYVFDRNQGGADNWGEVKKLTASDGAAGDEFGFSGSISGDTIVIGAYLDDVGANIDQGSGYVFERNQGGADNWGEVKKLTASDGAADSFFDIFVDIDFDTIVVGARGDDVGANIDQGSGYVFDRNQGGADNWGEVVKLTASDGAAGDSFGFSGSISGDTIVIGAYLDDVGANVDQGSGYVFERNQGGADNWGEVKKLTASDGAAGDGLLVDIDFDTIVVGARGDDVGANIDQGSGYVFERNQGGADNWGEVKKLTASDGAAGDSFGFSGSISGNTIVIGAPYDDVGANNNQGSGYVFEITGSPELNIPITLSQGWNFISVPLVMANTSIENVLSVPLVMANTSIENVLSSIDGLYDYVMWYDASDITQTIAVTNELVFGPALGGETGPFNLAYTTITDISLYNDMEGLWILGEDYNFDWTTGAIDISAGATYLNAGESLIAFYNYTKPGDSWKTYATFRPAFMNDLLQIDNTMGFWIRMLNSATLTVNGTAPVSTNIQLYAGWNLVGYPSLNTTTSIADALAGTGYTKVDGFNATAPYRISQLPDTYIMKPGEAYWIHVPADTVWVVD